MNVALRQSLDLFANLRPARTLPAVTSRYTDVDLVIVRENTEDLYSGLEHEVVPGVVESLKIITRSASTRIARFAFEYARVHRRRRITTVHKANIMKMIDGLCLDYAQKVTAEYPDIDTDRYHIDILTARFVTSPDWFDVVVGSNLFGDILSDLGPAVAGSIGIAPGANINPEKEFPSMFEPVHGSAPDIAGKAVANPIAQIWTGAMMLDHLGHEDAGRAVVEAIERVVRDGKVLTRDLGGRASTRDVGSAIAALI